MKNFQTVLLGIFGVIIVLAVLVFSGIVNFGGGEETELATKQVTLWGTLPAGVFESINRKIIESGEKFDITYVEIDENNFEASLIDALASGTGPDMIIGSSDLLIRQQDKILVLPYTAMPERNFRDSFVEATEVLLKQDGELGVPLYLDPLIMYWNRDMLTRAGIATPPVNWLEVQLYPERITKIDKVGNIGVTAVALGDTGNVNHFQDILAAQIMQTGNPIVRHTVTRDKEGKVVETNQVTLTEGTGAVSALKYYVEFGDPAKKKYSWNSAKHNSLDEFIGGDLALYFGPSSDLGIIQTRNPHLNFDVAEIPQISVTSMGGSNRLTFTRVYSFGIIKTSPNRQAAYAVAYKFALGKGALFVSEVLGVPPARRDLLSAGSENPFVSLFYKAAIVAKSWYNPNSLATRNIFSTMVESVMIGRSEASTALQNAEEQIRALLK